MNKQEVDKILNDIGEKVKESWDKSFVKSGKYDTIEIDMLAFINADNEHSKEQKEQLIADMAWIDKEGLVFIYENDKIKEVQYKEPMRKVVIELTIDPKENEVIQWNQKQ